jgi:hypothetical protein
MPEMPDLEKFWSDPAYQKDRDFMEGFMLRVLEKKQKEAEEKRKRDDDAQPKNIWDQIFAGKK